MIHVSFIHTASGQCEIWFGSRGRYGINWQKRDMESIDRKEGSMFDFMG